jgi:hypothetical protein
MLDWTWWRNPTQEAWISGVLPTPEMTASCVCEQLLPSLDRKHHALARKIGGGITI